MRVLGIETSCDETGVAIYDSEVGLLAHAVYSQTEIHAIYGGVVPELAARDHIQKTLPLIKQSLIDSRIKPDSIDGIAYTAGPGLIGALLIGAALGRSLAYAWKIPALGIHHLEGHLLACNLEKLAPEFPLVALLISGGHTLLIDVTGVGRYRILGETLDDAVGEAFDKTAKILGLPYPGGPQLAELAKRGDPQRFNFPRPMTKRAGLDFSFSGLKTYVIEMLTQHPEYKLQAQTRADLARAFEDAVVETLIIKCLRALKKTGYSRLVLAGGVSANQRLRSRIITATEAIGAVSYFPRPELCTDNGAMIAYTGWLRLRAGQQDLLAFVPRARWSLEELTPVF